MKTVLTAIAALLIFNNTSLASTTICHSVDNDLDRLACYDRESGRAPVVTTNPSKGSWDLQTKRSEFEDTTDVYISVQSKAPVACNMFGSHQPATLFLRCQENTTAIYLATNCHLASGFQGYGKVDVRVDDKKTATVSMDVSTDNEALGFWEGNKAIPFIQRQLLGGTTMRVRFTPFNASPVSAEFDITGIDDTIAALREQCGW